jgi:hypothetical protein
MSAPATEKELLKLKEAADLYSVSYDLLHDGVLEQRLPAIKPSKAWLVAPGDVLTFLRVLHDEKVEAAP